jgi:hypothetical protein
VIDAHRNEAPAGLQDDAVRASARRDDDGRPQHRVPGEGDFARRREDSNLLVGTLPPGVAEDGLRVADLLRQRLQQRLGNPCRILEDGELVTRQWPLAKDADDVK